MANRKDDPGVKMASDELPHWVLDAFHKKFTEYVQRYAATAIPVMTVCEKGGCGKTFTAVATGRASLMSGLPIVLADCDPYRKQDKLVDDEAFSVASDLMNPKMLAFFSDVDPDEVLGLKRELPLRVEQSDIFANRHTIENNYGILAQALTQVPNGVYDTAPNEALRMFETLTELSAWKLDGFPMMKVAIPLLNEAISMSESVETIRAANQFRDAAIADGAPPELIRRFSITVVYNKTEERNGSKIGNFGSVLQGTSSGRQLSMLLREQKALGDARWITAISFPNHETPLTEALGAAQIDRFRALRLHRKGKLAEALPDTSELTIRKYIGSLAEVMAHIASQLHVSGLVPMLPQDLRMLRDELGLRDGINKLDAFLMGGRGASALRGVHE